MEENLRAFLFSFWEYIPFRVSRLISRSSHLTLRKKEKKKTATYANQIHLAVITTSSAVRIHRKGMPNRMTKHLLVYWNCGLVIGT